ncbi:MAG: beta-glycosidase [Bacteroidales bacterium]|nr:beta-glycosidase [Bacteroidales bacterium]
MRRILAIILLAGGLAACAPRTDLSGVWEFRLDPEGKTGPETAFDDVITLPGTTDLAGKGQEPDSTVETGRLTRRHAYVGKAWYRKTVDIPRAWKGQDLVLFLERTKATTLYWDGTLVGSCNDVSTPQTYTLGHMAPGKHVITLCVDNGGGVPEGVIRSSHLYSEDTQTNWNGIIGRLELRPAKADEKVPGSRMPHLEITNGRFTADGHPVFLRGKHDACVFPLTGHTPMDKATWTDYFSVCRQYGINHVRFHSWCPPEAAFAAADELGIYLQPELPFWGTLEGDDLLSFLKKEGLNIVKTYGHHPSFALFSLGNELWGEAAVMQDLIETFRADAPQILYTNGTNAFLGYRGYVEGTDFQATCRTAGEPYGEFGTHVRSSFAYCDALEGGILNHFYPGTRRNFAEALKASPVPVVSHETGQFQSYPDYTEIDKYTGPLVPRNLLEFKRRLEAAGMADQAEDFHRASAAWQAQLYKADIEMCLRTPGLGGFQLLDLQDYPGQGSAYVGVLDAFMDSKGAVTPDLWRNWCSDIVPLAEFDKYCLSTDETFRASLKLAKFSEAGVSELEWSLTSGENVMASGKAECPAGEGLLDIGEIEMDLSGITAPARLDLNVWVLTAPDGFRENHWPLWVYPAGNQPDKNGIRIVRSLDASARKALENGESVLLMPADTTDTVGGLFQTDYWNYRMFKEICESNGKPVSPGTLGLLMDPSHPLFREFPTEEHTSWQWFPLVKASHPAILDQLDGYRPIIQVVDNVERNHRLGLVYEFKAGKGRLLVCCANLDKVTAWPEGRQFYSALLNYMRSAAFTPSTELGL